MFYKTSLTKFEIINIALQPYIILKKIEKDSNCYLIET